MKNSPVPAMPSTMAGRLSSRNTAPRLALPALGSGGRMTSFQASAMAATGTRQKKAPRQPITPPRKLPSGAATTVARAFPPFRMASARGTWSSGTRRIAVAADIDQKPPMATPIKARPIMKTV